MIQKKKTLFRFNDRKRIKKKRRRKLSIAKRLINQKDRIFRFSISFPHLVIYPGVYLQKRQKTRIIRGDIK